MMVTCPGGETGKRYGFKSHRPKGLAGSTPAPGTYEFGPMNASS